MPDLPELRDLPDRFTPMMTAQPAFVSDQAAQEMAR
jgi:hypothetical protein